MQVIFSEAADEQRSYFTRRATAQRTESHAYLLGHRTSDGVRIEHVLRPGHPLEEVARTRPDYEAAGPALTPYLDAGFSLLGEWHRHDGLRGPSGGDAQTLRSIAEHFPGYLCLITTTIPDGRRVTTAHSVVNDLLVEHEVMLERYEVLDRQATSDQSLLVFGAGSGLAAIYPQLLKLGLARITIIDHDCFETSNLDRHLADRAAIGKNKGAYLVGFARGRTTTKVRAFPIRVDAGSQRRIQTLMRDHTIMFNATGDPRTSLRISHTARQLRKPVLHAAVYARSRGGFIFRELPDGPCYADAQQLDVRTITDDNATMHLLREQYGYSEEELAGQVGLWSDVNTIAAFQLKALTDYLKGTPRPNLTIIDNEHLTIEHRTITQRATCICTGGPQ